MSGFRIISGKGFHITFANGYTVSVQFGGGNYCDNRSAEEGPDNDVKRGARGSATAEAAVLSPRGVMLAMRTASRGGWEISGSTSFDDTVQGYQTPENVLALMQWAAKQPMPNAEGAA